MALMDGYVSVPNDDRLKALFEQIFSDAFMQAHTNFSNFEAFRYSSAVIVSWDGPQLIYAKLLMDGFVKESTEYETWDEMVMAASDEAFGKQES